MSARRGCDRGAGRLPRPCGRGHFLGRSLHRPTSGLPGVPARSRGPVPRPWLLRGCGSARGRAVSRCRAVAPRTVFPGIPNVAPKGFLGKLDPESTATAAPTGPCPAQLLLWPLCVTRCPCPPLHGAGSSGDPDRAQRCSSASKQTSAPLPFSHRDTKQRAEPCPMAGGRQPLWDLWRTRCVSAGSVLYASPSEAASKTHLGEPLLPRLGAQPQRQQRGVEQTPTSSHERCFPSHCAVPTFHWHQCSQQAAV